MRLYYVTSGSKEYTKMLRQEGCQRQLRSFFFMKSAESERLIDGKHDLIDSGGFSARINGVTIDVRKYANFLNRNNIKLAFNLDTSDVEETLENQAYLDANCPRTYILPVYHVSDFVDPRWKGLLDWYIAMGYGYIGIGGVAGAKNNREQERRFYNYVFTHTKGDVRCHGLGITGKKILQGYPWYSCDSSSFLQPARFASMKTQSNEMARALAKSVKYTERVRMDLTFWKQLERTTDKLWANRGIEWSEVEPDKLIKQRNQVKKQSYEEWKVHNEKQ